MAFFAEPTGYLKTILSDLQGAWAVLRELVVENAGFEGWGQMLFHIDEAMSWETVRHLETMKPMVTLIRNIAMKGKAPEEIMQAIVDVSELLDEVLPSHNTGNQS